MNYESEVPDAWDADWQSQADTLATKPTPPEKKVSSKITKAQRRAQQAEFNRQLWAEAESPQTFHFVETRSDVPLRQDIKPAVTLLSRRPQIATRTRQQPSIGIDAATSGFSQLGLEGEEGDSDEDTKNAEPTPEERQAQALKNREEKQRKYEEVRERLFGSNSANTSGASSPRSTTPPRQTQQGEGRGKGKGRGGGRDYQKRDSSSTSSKSRHNNLFDPSSPGRSTGSLQKRDRPQIERNDSDKQTAPHQPVRSPRGPDASGRGGFKLNRGARGG
ncbi:hypothetical protein N7468_010287 [Penicillium chermesinum]|uniref:SUZ-C domain-containing protein n=1 Tax=Penicillium chermesinum TaxID=63820 RepID=A0A9W9TCD9_9EURO|nr:uncharacterized protein N7468_010287 [Penicillium chermesinum]KAJ5217279.1 hypothetical protein N7468_010287 [Penicillium chermesinum]KAJ6171110.1 hypothetical protein N7470_000177 [Penicillium chermesinum]